jgi:type II secretory pathway component PulM
MRQLLSRLAALGLLVLPVVLAYVLVLRPAIDMRDALREELVATQGVLERQQAALNHLPALRAEAQRLKDATSVGADRGWIAGSSPTQSAAMLQSLLKQAAASAAASIQSVKVLPVTLEDGNPRIAVRFVAVMPSAALPTLLGRLEASQEPMLLIEEVELHGMESGMTFGAGPAMAQAVSLRADLVAYQRRSAP